MRRRSTRSRRRLPDALMKLSKEQTRHLYRHTARYYDLLVGLYRLAGTGRYHRQAVEALGLEAGDTVVDTGCGTGANFRHLYNAVGPSGRVIGVDLTDAMLEKASYRIQSAGWRNIELVEGDIAEFAFPDDVKAAIVTFALEMVPEYDAVIQRTARALSPGGRLALLGTKHPEVWPEWLIRFAVWLNKPFGVSRDYSDMQPWKSLDRYFDIVEYHEHYFGALYLAVGETPHDIEET